jgi:hypothetical protein
MNSGLPDSFFGTLRATYICGQLGHGIKTPPPSLLRARFATVLEHLPSVPSVVLPIKSPTDKVGLPSF